MREALADVAGLSVAFVFGSVASGRDRPDSDIDLFVVEFEDFDRRAFYSHLSETQMLLGREVNAVRYRPDDLAQRLQDQEHPAHAFIQDVLAGPKIFLVGSEDRLDLLPSTSESDSTAGTPGAQGGAR